MVTIEKLPGVVGGLSLDNLPGIWPINIYTYFIQASLMFSCIDHCNIC